MEGFIIIDLMHQTFSKVAASNVISEKNAELYYDKINEIIAIINDLPNDMKFKDISNHTYERLYNILNDLENITSEELGNKS